MGCDIHMVLEKKTHEGWLGLHMFPTITMQYDAELVQLAKQHNKYLPRYAVWEADKRNYPLFAALAGVRGEGPEPRGVPDDMSALAQDFVTRWDADGHSHTWYTLDEALPIFAAHICPSELVGPDREFISNKLFDVDYDDLANHRLIIFFDN